MIHKEDILPFEASVSCNKTMLAQSANAEVNLIS
jgi:hypothetical protein